MNFQAILVANLTGFVLIMFLHFSRLSSRTKTDTEERTYDWMMRLSGLACLVEILTFAVDGVHHSAAYWVNMLGNTYLYYANGAGAFLWLMYLDLKLFHDRERLHRIYYKISFPITAVLFALLLNLKFHYFFYVDENYVYHRQPTIYIFYIYIMLCGVYSVALYIYRQRVYGKLTFFPIYMYLTPIVAGSVLQMIFYGISLAWLGTAIGLVALNMSLQQHNSYVDPLTGLYNRMYLEHALFKINQSGAEDYYGLMVDLNDFKVINDTYGHSAGDRALRDVAQIFRDTVDKDATVYRYAGDEFIIMTRAESDEAATAIEEALHQATEEFNRKHTRLYNLSFAIGHSHYEAEWDNTDSFLKRIDEAMYKDKKRFHEQADVAAATEA